MCLRGPKKERSDSFSSPGTPRWTPSGRVGESTVRLGRGVVDPKDTLRTRERVWGVVYVDDNLVLFTPSEGSRDRVGGCRTGEAPRGGWILVPV